MRPHFMLLVVVASLCSAAVLAAPTQTSSPGASSVALATLQSAIAVLSGRSSVTDITLTGTAERIAGSEDENGTATYKALPSSSRLDMSFSSGTRSEIRNTGSDGLAGAWIGPDGVSHSIAYHNLLTDPGWFPLFALSNINASSNSLIAYVGLENRNNSAVVHLSASQQFPSSAGADATMLQHLTQVDIYLDPNTLLPVSFVYNTHPDNDALLDIPTEIRYFNYRNIGGLQIPLHVQKLVNNCISLDLQFQSAVPNSGLSTTSFALP